MRKYIGVQIANGFMYVVLQSHRGKNFGVDGIYYAQNGICLASSGYPGYAGNTCILRGSMHERDWYRINVPKTMVGKYISAIKEYNIVFRE